MPDPRQLLRLGGPIESAGGSAHLLAGIVSTAMPIPTTIGEPLYVVIPAHSTELAVPVTRWAPLYGAQLPTAGAEALVAYDSNGRPYVVWWEGVPLPTSFDTNGLGAQWQLVFEDHFTGSALDPTKWAPGWYANNPATSITAPVVAGQLACFAPANVSVSGSYLSLAMTSGSYTAQDASTYTHATGMITTAPSEGFDGILFDFLYGYAEARVFVPGTSTLMDNWPAWWMAGIGSTGIPWPTHGEIDVMEGLSNDAGVTRNAWGNWHGATSAINATETSFGLSSSFLGSGAFHVYGASWTSTHVKWYYDGVLQAATGSTPVYQSGTPMYLVLANQANTSGSVPSTTMLVDYVRVWQPS